MNSIQPQVSSAPQGTKTARILAPNASWELLRRASVGRLAVVHDDAPDIFPVNYVVDHGTIVLRTGGGTKHEAARNHVVAFEVDGDDNDDTESWSVVVRGRATEIHAVDEAIAVMDLPLISWAPGARPHFLRITPDAITGRQFVRVPAAQRTGG